VTIRVLIADGVPVVRDGLQTWLEPPEFDVIDAAETGAAAVSAAARLHPDVLVLDTSLPDATGAEVCEAVLAVAPETAVVVFSAACAEVPIVAAADAGARAYVLKDSERSRLVEAVRRAARGERFVDPNVAAIAFEAHDRSRNGRLSHRELSVLRLAAEGLTNAEIGTRLFLSRHTVKEYLGHATRKLGVHGRVAAVVEAERRGLLEAGELRRAS
jgi:DNA-binding NarL/FixJ family response regulator